MGKTAAPGKPTASGDKKNSKPQAPAEEEKTGWGFTTEQFEHFKWGLIKKNGEKVPDYDKKLAHYERWKASEKARKVA
jgi:hypothetical protein